MLFVQQNTKSGWDQAIVNAQWRILEGFWTKINRNHPS